jgi:hypothetical protein
MHRRGSRSFHSFVLLCLALCLVLVAQAKDGRDFAGFYAFTNVTQAEDNVAQPDRGATVGVTLTVQIFNYSDLGDIKAPVLALLESGPSHALLGEFGTVKVLPARHDVIVSGHFTVPKEAFESWSRRGGSPKVVVIYRDAAGRTLRQNVQLLRRPVLPPTTAE